MAFIDLQKLKEMDEQSIQAIIDDPNTGHNDRENARAALELKARKKEAPTAEYGDHCCCDGSCGC